MAEFSRLLGDTEQSAPELAGAAIAWLCGQWAFLVLACVALLSLVLLLCLKERFRIQSTCKYMCTLLPHNIHTHVHSVHAIFITP